MSDVGIEVKTTRCLFATVSGKTWRGRTGGKESLGNLCNFATIEELDVNFFENTKFSYDLVHMIEEE